MVEREATNFAVEVKDPDAPVDFYINGVKIEPDDDRVEIKRSGNGKHELILNKISLEDAGTIEARTPSNYGDELITTMCSFNVQKGEEKPVIGNVPNVTGVAHKNCHWEVPYEVKDSRYV